LPGTTSGLFYETSKTRRKTSTNGGGKRKEKFIIRRYGRSRKLRTRKFSYLGPGKGKRKRKDSKTGRHDSDRQKRKSGVLEYFLRFFRGKLKTPYNKRTGGTITPGVETVEWELRVKVNG